MNEFLLSVIVPCYNEAENIPLLLERLDTALLGCAYEILLVNDGSSDGTQQLIEALSKEREEIRYLTFSRNFGHQMALKAGIDHAKGDCIVTLDADLQHPPETLPKMISLWQQGYDVVIAVRKYHGHTSLVKKLTSKGYYWMLSKISERDVIINASDFRLFDKKIACVLCQMPEKDLYLRGLFAWVGYKQVVITYSEVKRLHGTTKYNLKKMLQLAENGIASSSTKPLQFALSAGMFFAILAFCYGTYAIVMLLAGYTVPGWASIVASIVFLSGVQLMVLGVMGSYLGKMYMEGKRRPNYLIAKTNIKCMDNKTYKKERRASSVIV